MITSKQELVAELLAEEVRALKGAIGVLVQDVPDLAPEPVLRRLHDLLTEGVDLRIAYLALGATKAAAKVGLTKDQFSSSVQQAEKWRNQGDLSATIVVISTGDQARLSSLQDFEPVQPRQLKQQLVRRAQATQAATNEVQFRWWGMLRDDPHVSFGQLVDYYASLPDDDSEFKTQSSRELPRLGLLADPMLFDNPKDSAVRRRLNLNRELVGRLQTLTDKDRGIIAHNIAGQHERQRRAALNRSFRLLRRLRRGEDDADKLTLSDAQDLLAIRRPWPRPLINDNGVEPEEPTRQSSNKPMATVTAEALLAEDDEQAEALNTVVRETMADLNKSDQEPNLGPKRISVDLPSGLMAQGRARGDVMSLVTRFVGDGVYGGWLDAEGGDIEERIRRFHGDDDVRTRWTRERVEEYLANFDHEAARNLKTLFSAFDTARTEVAPYALMLAAEPLAAAAAPEVNLACMAYLRSYQALLDGVRASYPVLFDEYTSDADVLVGQLLTLDTIVLGSGAHALALVSPLHPLYLWHFAEYARVVADQRERLSPRDRKLVIEASKALPIFLSNLYLPALTADTPPALPQIGLLGPLPYFGVRQERSVGDDGAGPIGQLVRAFLDAYPPARLGLRLTLLDPPNPGIYLTLLADLHEDEVLAGGHLTLLRRPSEKVGTELVLTDDEEERIAQLFRATNQDRRFTFDVRTATTEAPGAPSELISHITVAFDQTDGRADRLATVDHPIQPIAMPQRLRFRAHSKTVELVPAPGGLFASYFNVAELVAKSSPASYFSVHQQKGLREKLGRISERSEWFILADRHVDRDLDLGALRIYSGREGGREVAAFAKTTDPFRRALREVVRQYNTAVSNVELDELLVELTDLLDAGTLAISPGVEGKVDHNRIKGLLGTLIASRWFRTTCPDDHLRLLISLDDPTARRWLHLRDDALRADLLGIEAGRDTCTLAVFEIKAMQSLAGEYSIEGGVASGPAVDQLLSTRRLLDEVFAKDRGDELITTPARREILREHIYRELTKPRHTPEQRRRWVTVAEDLFGGKLQPTLDVHLVEVYLGVDTASLNPPLKVSIESTPSTLVPLFIIQLNESQVDALKPAESPPTDEPRALDVPRPDQEPPPQPSPTPAPRRLGPEETGDRDEEGPPTQTAADGGAGRPRAYLGEAPGTYGKPVEAWYDPQRPGGPLPNSHISITGETGSGKTQATKAILRDLISGITRLPVLILDFKDDYSQPSYVETEGLAIYDASMDGLPFNPMVPPTDPRSGRANPMGHIHQLGEIIKRIYRLGDQQAFHLREAMKETYEIQGIATRPFKPGDDQEYLPFEAIRDVLVREGHDALLGRLSPIFDLGLFAASEETTSLTQLLQEPAVIRLSQLPGDEVKNAVAEFLLMALYNQLIRQPQPRTLRRLLVLDEAWRLIQSPFLEPLMREGRAFGLGVVVATQYPKDLPDTVAGATATRLFFSQNQPEQVREIQRTLVGKTSGVDAERVAATVRSMPPLTCLMNSAHYQPFSRVTVHPYYERVANGTSARS